VRDGSGAERGRRHIKNAKAFVFLFLLTWHPERKGREELGDTEGRPEFPLLPFTAKPLP
jgi:hypothetical protein